MPIREYLKEALRAPRVVNAISHALEGCPEGKHEDLACTHISAHLHISGRQSLRIVSRGRRRLDIDVDRQTIEAKYHIEGDLLKIESNLANGTVYRPGASGTATQNILHELERGNDSYFLWLVCVRDQGSTNFSRCKYQKITNTFYERTGIQSLEDAAKYAERLIDRRLRNLFAQRKPGIRMSRLPRIEAGHCILLCRLYRFPRQRP